MTTPTTEETPMTQTPAPLRSPSWHYQEAHNLLAAAAEAQEDSNARVRDVDYLYSRAAVHSNLANAQSAYSIAVAAWTSLDAVRPAPLEPAPAPAEPEPAPEPVPAQ